MSTLPPEPSYNPNVPVISSAGGTAAAYQDPNSPESIMKKTTLAKAQGQVDTKYDVNLSAVEGFKLYTPTDVYILYVFVVLLLITLFTQTTKARKLFILSLASFLLVLSIYLLQRNVRL
jgi:hypothetical protein